MGVLLSVTLVFVLSAPASVMMLSAAARTHKKLYAPSTFLLLVGLIATSGLDLADDVPSGILTTYIFAGLAFVGSWGIYHVMGKDTWGSVAEAAGAGFGIISVFHGAAHFMDLHMIGELQWYQFGYPALVLSTDILLAKVAIELWRDHRRMTMALSLALVAHTTAVTTEFVHDTMTYDRIWHVIAVFSVGSLIGAGMWYGYERTRAAHLGHGAVVVEPQPSYTALVLTSLGFASAIGVSVLSSDHGSPLHSIYLGISCFAALVMRQIATLDLMRHIVNEANTERQHYQLIVANTGDAIGLVSPADYEITYVSGVVRDLLGLEAEAVTGKRLYDVLDISPQTLDEQAQSLDNAGYAAFQVNRDQRTLEVSLRQQRKLVRFTVSDVTGTAALEHRLESLASVDSLTGLPNRPATMRAAEEKLHASEQLSVIFLDLTGFKMANDTYGHAAGDEALRVVARRFENLLPNDAVLGRLGGDEFLVALGTDSTAAIKVAKQLVQAVTQPISIHGDTMTLGCAAGVCEERGQGLVDLVREADMAMYAAKSSKDTNVVSYESSHALNAQPAATDQHSDEWHNITVQPVLSHNGDLLYGNLVIEASLYTPASAASWDYVLDLLHQQPPSTRLAVPVRASEICDDAWRSTMLRNFSEAGLHDSQILMSVIDTEAAPLDEHFLHGAQALRVRGIDLILPRIGADTVLLADSPSVAVFSSFHYHDIVARALENRSGVRPVVFELAHWASQQGIETVLTSVSSARQRKLAASLGVSATIDASCGHGGPIARYLETTAQQELVR